jgi:CubicO group peptidase (beta-lactamase class C family)
MTTLQDAIASALEASVDAGDLACAAAVIHRPGQATQFGCAGWRDLETRAPLQRDTLFRIASMTKPITSTAAMMLIEEGRIGLQDPIAKWAPEFSEMRVLRRPDGPLDDTERAERAITFEDLLTHRSGITYGAFWPGPLATAYHEALGADIDSAVAPDAWIARLAALPLIEQPGRTLHYGHSTDLLGLLIARIEGMPLGDVLARRIFAPLGMKDTGFTVPREKHHRRARPYGFDEAGRLTPLSKGPGDSFLSERPVDMAYVSGGQGLWSTVDDYLAFARLFVGKGAVDGVRLLRPETVALMCGNRLTDAQRATSEVARLQLFSSGHGFGLGVAVVLDPKNAMAMLCGGGAGAVGWPGGFGGWWQADPNDGSVLVFLTHNMLELDQMAKGIGLGVYRAIARFQAAART